MDQSPPSTRKPSQKFYTKYLNSYVNYHRPCGFAQLKTLARDRLRIYPAEEYRTPI